MLRIDNLLRICIIILMIILLIMILKASIDGYDNNKLSYYQKWESCLQYCDYKMSEIPVKCLNHQGSFMPNFYGLCQK